MKVAVIRDSNGNAIAALHTEPRILEDGREVTPVFQLRDGQTSEIVEVADHLRGAELLRVAARGGRSSS
jgi:hypothetical protein